MSNHDPHAKAAGAYGTIAAGTDQRTLEGTILLKAAWQLEELARRLETNTKVSREEIGDVLGYNQKLWQLFVEDMMNDAHPLPQEIKNNIGSLALFVFKRTNEILIDTVPEKFKVLININRNIASGLMKKMPVQAPPRDATAKPLPETTITALDNLA